MIPTSAEAIETDVLWPPQVAVRPGRPRRRRLEARRQAEKFEVDVVLPAFPQVVQFLCCVS